MGTMYFVVSEHSLQQHADNHFYERMPAWWETEYTTDDDDDDAKNATLRKNEEKNKKQKMTKDEIEWKRTRKQ